MYEMYFLNIYSQIFVSKRYKKIIKKDINKNKHMLM